MQITVASTGDLMFSLDVSDDIELENFKALCEAESGIAIHQISLSLNGQDLTDDKKPLSAYGVRDGDVLAIRSASPPSAIPDFSGVRLPGGSQRQPEDDPAVIRNMILANPEQLSHLRQKNPALADAAVEGLEQFAKALQEQRSKSDEMRIRMLMANPFDTEAQRLIAEEIKRQNIEANMETAMEYHPESYGQVTMLYISCKVNGHPVKAFVDSGAQSTIMSHACAERCNIVRLIDNRWAGIAKGVGTQRITGRIHLCQVQIEQDFLASSFTILQEQPMDMLLGLDMLKRHQCSIDLKRNVLLIGTTGTETRFLNENEIPDALNLKAEDAADDIAHAIDQSLRQNPTTSSSSSGGGGASKSDPSEAAIQEIVKSGFSRSQAIQELKNFNGDVQKALAALVAKSLQFPK
jgi:DNA damage-inducible protein 1